MTQLQAEKNVIFGTGPLGLAVMDELVARGRSVTLVNRSGRVSEALPAGAAVQAGDARDPAQVAALVAETDVVFHCAQPGYHEWPEKFPPITNGILAGGGGTGVRLVMGDNLYMYGPTGGQPIRESMPYAASGRKGRCRAEMAQTVLAAHERGEVKATLGRASDFYGPRVLGSALGEMFFGPALVGESINVLGNPDLPHTYTYIRDFARGLVTLSEHEKAFGRAWHVPSGPTVSTREFAQWVGEQAGQPVKLRAAGPFMVSVLGLFSPDVREMREMLYEFNEPFLVDDSDFRAAFPSEVTPHDTAIAETLAWFRVRHSRPVAAR